MLFLLVGAVLLNVYAVVLIASRGLVYHTRLYRPMLLNVALSILPIFLLAVTLGVWVLLLPGPRPLAYIALAAFGIVWLLMLPNASYLITELNQSHRAEGEAVPLWYDIILVISLAMSGVVNTIVNVLLAHFLIVVVAYDDSASGFLKAPALLAVGGVLLLVAFGMYLGRYLRLNSWDVTHPPSLVKKVVAHFRQRGNLLVCGGFTATHTVFLGLMYLIIAGPVIDGLVALENARAGLG